MVILAVLYAVLVWLIYFRLKIIRWGWLAGTVAVRIGAAILATFSAYASNRIEENASC